MQSKTIILKRAILILFVACTASYAEPVKSVKPASDDSIRQLLEVTNTRKLLDSVMTQMDGMMKGSIQQAMQGQPVTPKQQQIMQDMEAKMIVIFKDELAWEKLEPMYLKVYRESFTQDEVDGMLAFYKTPAGQALINKMPLVMQRSMGEMQKSMGPMIERFKMLQAQTVQALKMQADMPPAQPPK